MSIEFLPIFPTVIGYKQDIAFTDKALLNAKEILNDKNNLTNAWNYKNTYGNLTIAQDKSIEYISQYIIQFAKEYLQNTMVLIEKLNLDVELFFSEMNSGDHHGTHAHPNCLLSGICYLATTDSSSDIIFRDPRNHYDYVYLETVNNIDVSTYSITPRAGLILIWPAWVKHEVPVNKTNGRITAVFNIVQKF
jgi:uncharacterized protein (TIGR02466 family)